MAASEIVGAAVIAGIIMAIATDIGYRLGIVRGNLLQVDGEFALKNMRIRPRTSLIYLIGIIVHLSTSAIFGVILFGITKAGDINASSIKLVAPYVFVLWIAMLVSALPVAGQGFLGRKLASSVWVEQFFLHAVFFAVFWGLLNFFEA